ncbi:Exosome complex component MTR3 [Bagarius yarrelli]|uniref:Exosome complex component MTR3 n=1 Tax=Bagarius yarrelli TaxID=175774 RepID=A0A556VXL2_BAGYA|nr:Exosome complex component MTR3 [Bagarius yarrelli]
MPVDTKRIRGPEVSQSPLLFVSSCPQTQDVSSREGARGDSDVRPLFARCGLVSQAKGSAYLEAGNTKIMCSVYGPREAERKDEADMKSGRADGEMREDALTAAVRTCVEGCHRLYPVVQQAILRGVKRKAPPPAEK